MIEKYSKVFVPVSVGIRLPDKNGIYLLKMKQGSGQYKPHSFDIDYQNLFKQLGDNWLEEKENVYVLSEQELIALMNSCIHNGMCCTPSNVEEFAKNYIQSKTNPQTEIT